MRKIRINYDFFDKIKETQGKCKIRRWIKNNKFQDGLILTFTSIDITEYLMGIESLDKTALDILTYFFLLGTIMPLLEIAKNNIIEKNTGKTQEDYAFDELNNLTANKTYELSNGTSFKANGNGSANVSLKLSNNQSVTLKDIPVGAKYKAFEYAGDYVSSYVIIDSNNLGLIASTSNMNTKTLPKTFSIMV